MIMIKSFLFPTCYGEKSYSVFLLALRILFGLLLASHGLQKLLAYSSLAAGGFPDPLGIGSGASACLAIFGELFCSVAFIFGFLYRLSMIPMIVTMAVAFGAVHGWSINQGELAFAYLLVFIVMYIAGPGLYSVDGLIAKKFYGHSRRVRMV